MVCVKENKIKVKVYVLERKRIADQPMPVNNSPPPEKPVVKLPKPKNPCKECGVYERISDRIPYCQDCKKDLQELQLSRGGYSV